MPSADLASTALEQDGIVILPDLLSSEALTGMRDAFCRALSRMRINDIDGYQKTERLRDVVDDILLLDQGFLSLGVDSSVSDVARRYIGPDFQLVECKGWRSRKTLKDWHGWHGDAWYDQNSVQEIPRELKLGVYLSDVHSGGFAYLKGSHRKVTPCSIPLRDIGSVWDQEQVLVNGQAGTAFLFDTSGIHRQSTPMLEPRMAAFYCYHSASLPLQAEDRSYGRYHPLLLNAAFLGGLTAEQQRILGFGDSRNLGRQHRPALHPLLDRLFSTLLEASFVWTEVAAPFARRLSALRDRRRVGRDVGPPSGRVPMSHASERASPIDALHETKRT